MHQNKGGGEVSEQKTFSRFEYRLFRYIERKNLHQDDCLIVGGGGGA